MPILSSGHNKTETMTEREFDVLAKVLKLMRSKEQPGWIKEAIDTILIRNDIGQQIDFNWLIGSILNDHNRTTGSIIESFLFLRESVIPLREDEGATMAALLPILRSQSWLAEFFELTIDLFAKGNRPTPNKLIEWLLEPAANFAIDVERAQELILDYPEFFKSELDRLAPKTPASATPANPEPTSKPRRKKVA